MSRIFDFVKNASWLVTRDRLRLGAVGVRVPCVYIRITKRTGLWLWFMSLLSARLSPALVLLVVLLIFFPYVRRVLVLVGVFFFVVSLSVWWWSASLKLKVCLITKRITAKMFVSLSYVNEWGKWDGRSWEHKEYRVRSTVVCTAQQAAETFGFRVLNSDGREVDCSILLFCINIGAFQVFIIE